MASVKANGIDASETRITLPRVGIWHADLTILASSGIAAGDSVSISIASGAWTLTGTALRSRAFEDAIRVRVVAGAGGMGATAGAKFYKGAATSLVLSDLLGAAAEARASTTDAAFLSALLPAWSVFARPVGVEVTTLVSSGATGTAWRALSDGTIWIGAETWPASAALGEVQSRDDERGRVVFACEVPALVPGTTWEGDRIGDVEHVVTSGHTSTIAWVYS